MKATELILVMKSLNALIDLVGTAGVNMNRFVELKRKAESEGRDISDAELLSLSNEAREAIENARNV